MATPLPPSTIGIGAIYTPSATSNHNIKREQPRTSPIAHFASLPNDGVGNDLLKKKLSNAEGIPSAGRLLAVNSRYIAYAVKKGLVRVIDRKSAAKTLLRGHDESTRLVDANFFGDLTSKEGVGGVWDSLHVLRNGNNVGVVGGMNPNGKPTLPPAAASDVLATLGGHGDSSSVLIWRIHSSNNGSTLGADKLLEVRFGLGARIIWHPFNPNRFLMLHRNLGSEDGMTEEEDGVGEGGRAVATLVETTRLVTYPHDTEGHMVCDCKAPEGGGGGIPGMIPLKVNGDDASSVGANDVSWSNKDAKHVVTGHDDGMVRLWDLTRQNGGAEGELSIPCAAQLDVAASANDSQGSKRVTRVIFLSQYESPSSATAITPPFITGTDMNHTVTLWSSFSSSASPRSLRVFRLQTRLHASLSSILSVELIPSPYRPPLIEDSAADVTVPSSFLLMAERESGTVHALHLDTEWTTDDGGNNSIDTTPAGSASVGVAVTGFDYVATLNVVHPVYSFCVAPTTDLAQEPPHPLAGESNLSPGGHAISDRGRNFPPMRSARPQRRAGDAAAGAVVGAMALRKERDVELCCIQSKAVQMLTLSAEMCVFEKEDIGTESGDLAPGVTLLELPDRAAEVVSDDEEDGDDDDDVAEEDFEEEEYDMEDELAGAVEYSTNDDGGDIDDEDEGDTESGDAVPAVTEAEPNAFSNWLGAIANPLPPPTAEAAPNNDNQSSSSSAPPPGMGFSLEDLRAYKEKNSIHPPPPGIANAALLAAETVDAMASSSAPLPAPAANSSSSMAFLSPMQILSGSILSGSGSDSEPKKKQHETSSAAAVPPPPANTNSSMTFLSPMQIMSGSGSDLELNKKQPPAAAKKPTSPVPPPAGAPTVVPPPPVVQRSVTPVPPGMSKAAAAPAPKVTKKTKKKGQQDKKTAPNQQPTVAAPMKILQREEPKDNTTERSSILPPHATSSPAAAAATAVDLSAIEASIQNSIAAQLKSHETQLLTTLRKTISTEVNQALRASLEKVDKSTELAVQRGVSLGISSGLGVALENNGKLGQRLEQSARESAAMAAREAVGGMQMPIVNTLQQTMREVMIPAYESATRQMFQQTSTTLERGLAQMSINQTNASAQTFQEISQQMMKMNEAIASLSAEVVQLRGVVNTAASAGGGMMNPNANGQQQGHGVVASPPQPPVLDIRDEIKMLCQSHRYEEAFTKIVSASDGEFVLYACNHIDCAAVFNGEVSISQPILICLLQQLGAVLVSATEPGDIKTVLTWLQEVAVTIDPRDASIERHVTSVVQQLLANINNKMANCDREFRRPLQMLMQVIRGLL